MQKRRSLNLCGADRTIGEVALSAHVEKCTTKGLLGRSFSFADFAEKRTPAMSAMGGKRTFS